MRYETVAVLIGMLAQGALAQTTVHGKRAENQQDRVAQGMQSGQITAGEAAKVGREDAAIHREVRNDRAANGGKLTAGEKAQVNRQQNRVSKQIYQDKHNAAVQAQPKTAVGARRENQQDRIAAGVASGQLSAGQTAQLERQQAGVNREVRTDRALNGGRLTAAEKAQVNRQQNVESGRIARDKGAVGVSRPWEDTYRPWVGTANLEVGSGKKTFCTRLGLRAAQKSALDSRVTR